MVLVGDSHHGGDSPVTAPCWQMRWWGRVCSCLRSFAKPWRCGSFLLSFRRAFASKRRRHKMFDTCKTAEAGPRSGGQVHPTAALPACPRSSPCPRPLQVSPMLCPSPHLHKTLLQGHAVPSPCRGHDLAGGIQAGSCPGGPPA